MSQGKDLTPLKNAAGYREFLEAYLSLKGIAVAQFSRRAGFASRGYPAEILKGRRKLSAKALPRFLNALQLPTQWKLYFQYLVALEEPGVLATALTDAQLRDKLERLRKRLSTGPVRAQAAKEKDAADRIFGVRGFLRLYAALGEPGTGATLAQVAARTRFDRRRTEKDLGTLIELGLIRRDGESGRFHPASTHLSLVGMGGSDVFRSYFLETVERIRSRATARFGSERELFLVSSFTVNAKDLPAIKQELREVVLKYVDERIESEGDTAVDLAVGLVSPD